MRSQPPGPDAVPLPFEMTNKGKAPPAPVDGDAMHIDLTGDNNQKQSEGDENRQDKQKEASGTTRGPQGSDATGAEGKDRKTKRSKKKRTETSSTDEVDTDMDADTGHPSRWTAHTIEVLENLPARPSLAELKLLTDVALKAVMQANGIHRPHGGRMPENATAVEEWLRDNPGRELQLPAPITRRPATAIPRKTTPHVPTPRQACHPDPDRPLPTNKPTKRQAPPPPQIPEPHLPQSKHCPCCWSVLDKLSRTPLPLAKTPKMAT